MLFRCVFLAILLKCTEHASCHEKRASLPSAFVGTWLLSSNQQEMLIRKQTATQMRFRPSVAAPKMQIRNTFNDNSDKPLVSEVIASIHFTSLDSDKLSAWIKKWPFGTFKDNFGLPKSILPMSASIAGPGVKICFKGTPDPWIYIALEDGKLNMHRNSMMSQDMLRVSELKQREEKRLFSKLKEDLAMSKQEGCGAVLTNADKALSFRGTAP